MTHDVSEKVACRACRASISRDAPVCPACGAREPSISDEPSVNPRLIRLVMWSSGIVLGLVLLVVAWMLAYGPAADDAERDHSPPRKTSAVGGSEMTHDSSLLRPWLSVLVILLVTVIGSPTFAEDQGLASA